MKLLIFVISLFNIVTLSNNYQTKEQEFQSTIHQAYDKYVYEEYNISVGDLNIVIGSIDDDMSFSIYFNSIDYPKYQLKVIVVKSDAKEYVLSNQSEFEIYYNIEVKKNTKYYLEIFNNDSNTIYNRYEIANGNEMSQFDESKVLIGNGTHNFPYETKLKTKLSLFKIIAIIIGLVIIIEVIAMFIIMSIKKKKKKNK